MRRSALSGEPLGAARAGRVLRFSLFTVMATVVGAVFACSAHGQERSDGTYGRLDGDLLLGAEVGVTETIGNVHARGESLAVRLSVLYLSTAGLFGQHNESFGLEAQPIARSTSYGVEIRPLFLGRWAQDLEQGPAHLDLWLDSISLSLGMQHHWRGDERCSPRPGERRPPCHDFGMEFGLGMLLPLLPAANTPFIALRGAVRWSLSLEPDLEPAMGLLTLTLGYHHLFATHLVDLADRTPP